MSKLILKVIIVLCVIAILGAVLFTVFILGCDSPPQEPEIRTPPTVAYFFEFEWELTTETAHHCPQPWDTHLWMPGEVVTLHGRQTRYPFLAAAGGIPAPVTDYDSTDTYNVYNVQWRGECEIDWKLLRVLMVPNAGIIWVQLDGGIAGDKLRLVEP